MENLSQTKTHMQVAYSRDLPVGLTLFSNPQLLGRRPITYKSMFSYLYEQQNYRETQGKEPPQCRNLDDPFQDQLHGKMRRWLKMAAGRDRRLNVDIRIQSKEKFDGISAQPKRSPEEEDIFEAQESLFQYFFARRANSLGNTNDDGSSVASEMSSLFFGMRQIASHSPEYISTIYDWSVYFSCVQESKLDGTFQGSTPNLLTPSSMPDYIKNILLMAQVKLNYKGENDMEESLVKEDLEEDNTEGLQNISRSARIPRHDFEVGAVSKVEKYSYNPVVMSKVNGIMNALVPPRLLIFFDIDHRVVEKHFRNRERRQRKIEMLLKENASHPGNKRLLRELQEEKDLQLLEDPVVGEAMLLIEQPSMSQSTRVDLVALEHDLEQYLISSGSRCWGLPLKMNPQSANFPSGPKSDAYKKTGKGEERNSIEIIRQEPQNPINSTPIPQYFFNTVAPHAKPSAATKESGGTASVSQTLNIVELSYGRTAIYLHLLGEELLRQITLELPERGVLLKRLLSEAVLSLRMYDVVLSEASQHSGELLLIGQKDRAEQEKKIRELEVEVEALKKKKAAFQEKKKSLKAVIEHQKVLEIAKAQQDKNFEDALLQRLRTHAEEVKAMQDRERKGSETEEGS